METLFTIGYGGRGSADFIKLLQDRGVKTLVDVRLRPDRASMGIWVKAKTPEKGIQRLIAEGGIAYVSLPELGNVFLDYEDWAQRYTQLLERAGDLLITRLDPLERPLCLLCAEKKAVDCLRRLIAEYLAQIKHLEIKHIEKIPTISISRFSTRTGFTSANLMSQNSRHIYQGLPLYICTPRRPFKHSILK